MLPIITMSIMFNDYHLNYHQYHHDDHHPLQQLTTTTSMYRSGADLSSPRIESYRQGLYKRWLQNRYEKIQHVPG